MNVTSRIQLRRAGAFAVAMALFSLAPGTRARAEDVAIRATLSPTTVSVGSEAVLTVTVEGKFRRTVKPELPEIADLYVYESGTSQSFSVVNGQMSSSVTFTYTVAPQKEGSYEIAPITFTLDDKQYTAEAVTLEATAASSSVSPPSQSPSAGAGAATEPEEEGELPDEDQSIFITATTDRDTCYVNQQVTWTLGYYADGRVGLLRSPNYSPPQAEGFWVEDLPPQNKYYTNLHGRQYLVNEIKRAYFPTAPGVYEIGPARVDIVLDEFTRPRNLNDFFDRPLRSRAFGESKSLRTQSRRVVVLPLPQNGKPADFSGIVARNLRVSLSADKQVAQVGEPINVTVELSGIGNIKTISPPSIVESDKYKTYESGSKSDTFKKDYVVSGRLQHDFVVIPQVEGKWSIPSVELSYFDPVAKRYQVARSHAVPLEVKPGSKEEGRKVIYAGGGDDIDVISRDIRYIHSVPAALAVARRPLYRNGWYIGLHVVPLLAVVGSLFVERRRRRYRDDVVFARSSRALRDAARRLTGADKLFADGDVEGGYAELAAAVTGYFADKMNAARAGLTSETIESFMHKHALDMDVVETVRAVVKECDAARFAAGSVSAGQGREAVSRAEGALRSVEKGVRS